MRSFITAAAAALPFAFASPILNQRANAAVPGKYLVVLKPGAVSSSTEGALATVAGGLLGSVKKDHIYEHGSFRGFAGALSNEQVSALRADPTVAYVEADGIAHTQQEDLSTESSAPWGLGRISHRTKGSTDYLYDPSAGQGTCAYIVDTGIYVEHPELEGRATFVKSYTGVNTDDNGHGTHVSGTIGSATYGVAKKTSLFAIKVLDAAGSGTWSDIISGIGLVVSDSKTRSCPNGVVVNMSLGGDKSQAVNDAVAAAVDAGIFFAVAAGNEAADFSTTSPASEPKAFAVGASDVSDNMASFSNYGSTLGIFAPGVDVLSIWNDGKTNTISGTSMATPHIAGLGAYVLGLSGAMTPSALASRLQSLATTGSITLASAASTSPNLLAFNGAGTSSGEDEED
jgi:subtilisin family serine protease